MAFFRRPKYRAMKTLVDGNVFASKAESKRYLTLKAMQEAGEIRDLRLQPRYELQPKQPKTKARAAIRAVVYVADFEYRERDGRLVVEDVKGMETPVYKLKRKLFLVKYGDVDFREIRK